MKLYNVANCRLSASLMSTWRHQYEGICRTPSSTESLYRPSACVSENCVDGTCQARARSGSRFGESVEEEAEVDEDVPGETDDAPMMETPEGGE